MRCIAALLAALTASSMAGANHAVYVDETKVIGCLLLVEAPSVSFALNCGVSKSVSASEPPGGQYRLTATWTPGAPEWQDLRADLKSCVGACSAGGSGACVNNVCVGNPGGGNVVQQASNQGSSPLVVSISTAGNEDTVVFRIVPVGPVFTSLKSQGVRYVLEHVG